MNAESTRKQADIYVDLWPRGCWKDKDLQEILDVRRTSELTRDVSAACVHRFVRFRRCYHALEK